MTEGAAGAAHARPDPSCATTSAPVPADDLPLQRAYRWERERAQQIFLSQPCDGRVRDWTWTQALAESRSIAAIQARYAPCFERWAAARTPVVYAD